jgi:hypothetical protein
MVKSFGHNATMIHFDGDGDGAFIGTSVVAAKH